MLTKEEYLARPCRVSSLPYWKAVSVPVPDDMAVIHEEELLPISPEDWEDTPYFRLRHDLQMVETPALPAGYTLLEAEPGFLAAHLRHCYGGGPSEAAIRSWQERPVYDRNLWLAVRDDAAGIIAATAVAELDRDLGEGSVEWVQVSPAYRSLGIGTFLVLTLLQRLQNDAAFVTVSGQCSNPWQPERLYRRCGFTGSDVWHVLRRKKTRKHGVFFGDPESV